MRHGKRKRARVHETSLIGCRVRRFFAATGAIDGTVKSARSDDSSEGGGGSLWRVQHDDGDHELPGCLR